MYTGFSVSTRLTLFLLVYEGKYTDSEAEYAVRLLSCLKCALGWIEKPCSRKLTWLAGWVMLGRCFVSSMVDSVSPLVCTISAGPLEAVFSMIGIRSSNAGLHGKDKEIGWGQETRARGEPSNIKSDWLLKLRQTWVWNCRWSFTSCDHIFWKVHYIPQLSAAAPRLCCCHILTPLFWFDCRAKWK